jgi:hypothetical protein
MSNIVVGINSSPAIKPQRIDCGLLNTTRKDPTVLLNQLSSRFSCFSFGEKTARRRPIPRPAMPMPIQKRFHARPSPIMGPTTNCPADPPAIPNICVAPTKEEQACDRGYAEGAYPEGF